MIGAMIAITFVLVVVAYALRSLSKKPPIVLACSAITVALGWITQSLNVCLWSIVASGVIVAAVEAFVRSHEGTVTP
jgi:hypothetical protein